MSEQELPTIVAGCIERYLEERVRLDRQVKSLHKELLQLAGHADYKAVVEALVEQPGVGPFSAICFVLEIGDIGRFGTAGSLANYLGLTPGEYSSGDNQYRGHILKCGPGRLRALLLQCGWMSQRLDPELHRVFQAMVPRMGRKRAIVAITRRLALRLRARWIAALDPVEPQAAA